MARQLHPAVAQVLLVLRILGACVVAALWVLAVFVAWITRDLVRLEADSGDPTWVVLLLLTPVTALAAGAAMLLVQPKPLRTPYSVTALLLVITGAAAVSVLIAL